MRLALRLFFAFLLLEMVGLYHCYGQHIKQVSYPNHTNIHGIVDQLSPSEFSLIDLIEFIEGKDGDENSEEDTDHNLSSANEVHNNTELNNDLPALDQRATDRLLNFKENKPPFFILFQSWKFHLA